MRFSVIFAVISSMANEVGKRLFSFIFLFIFFVKMGIAVAPLIAITLDAKSVYAVIMQLEIEHSTSTDKGKETVKEYCSNFFAASSPESTLLLTGAQMIPEDADHFYAFYPSVPTPPPNV